MDIDRYTVHVKKGEEGLRLLSVSTGCQFNPQRNQVTWLSDPCSSCDFDAVLVSDQSDHRAHSAQLSLAQDECSLKTNSRHKTKITNEL